LKIHRGESMIGGFYSLLVQRAGARYAALRRTRPGALPGKGYNYDDLWGGLLNETRLPVAL
jgi:hypothetical protein